jgi:CubicO group peptidase (beta-lactamase class C family)
MKNTDKNSCFFLLVSFLATTLLVGISAYAQDKTGEIDKIFSWATPTAPGCVVAVSHHGKLLVNRAYGLADLERDVPLSTNSLFDAGSVRKQFVAAAILLLVEEGRLSLSDDVRKHVPQLPDYGHKITLDHLLTHTSGLRDWPALLNLASGNPDAMTMILRQRGLNFAPGEEWSYSNSGYVLLTDIVARTSGMSFAEFTRKRLFEPLGMKSTRYVDDLREVVKNRALAYEKEGNRWKMDILLGNDRGGGGALFTTPSDLVIWNEALTNTRLGALVSEKLQEPATLSNGRKLGYARGLYLDASPNGRVVWHSGSAGAYKSLAGRLPEHGLSIAILCNSGDSTPERTMFARRIFDLFVPATVTAAPGAEAQAPAPVAGGTGAAGVEVSTRAGLFFSERTGQPMRLVVNNGRLLIAGGGPALVPVTTDRFRTPRGVLSFMSNDEFELRFLSQDQLELKSMEGQTTRYARAQPYAPTAADLQAFAGRYESDELRAVFEMTPGKGGLMVRLNDAPGAALEFRPVDRDTFQRGMITVRFRRDKAGKIVALDFSNPVLRKVEFTRLSDR